MAVASVDIRPSRPRPLGRRTRGHLAVAGGCTRRPASLATWPRSGGHSVVTAVATWPSHPWPPGRRSRDRSAVSTPDTGRPRLLATWPPPPRPFARLNPGDPPTCSTSRSCCRCSRSCTPGRSRGRSGVRAKQRPDLVPADRSYDHDRYRRLLWARGIKPVIARRGVEHGSRLGTQRCVVERVFAHLHNFRRLRTRYARNPEIHPPCLTFACAVMCSHSAEAERRPGVSPSAATLRRRPPRTTRRAREARAPRPPGTRDPGEAATGTAVPRRRCAA